MVTEIAAQVEIVELGVIYTTPFTIELDVGIYTLRATNLETGEILPDRTTMISEAVTTREDFYFAAPPAEYTLTIGTTVGGTTNPLPDIYIHVEGTTVPITAIPDIGYNFDHWIQDGVTYTSNPRNVLMDGNHTLIAYFSEEEPPPPPTYKLTISSAVGGTTDPIPGILQYDAGVTAIVTAIAENGYYFNHWELDGLSKTENPIPVLMDKDHTLLANFSVTPPVPEFPLGPALALGGGLLLALIYLGFKRR